ncbi:MAG: adenylate/guanylate cyclase domain-containing protein [Rhodoferax sp.]|nr:adenylate/guanylate cyclase domain-containing protein [Rhodoferax sp.]
MSGSGLKQRLAAILAADAAGYSRLMSLDERATVAALDASRAVFHNQTLANQGRVVDTAGDSVLAVFETAAGALTAAIEIQAGLANAARDIPVDRRMQFRIGIHSGDVMEKADGSVYGDGVNIAARLQALAEPGQITVSDAIHGAVRGKVAATFIDQGEQLVKNIAHPVRAYRVLVSDTGIEAPDAKSWSGGIGLPLPDKPSIAVLPFTNMSGEPAQEYFTDGITEDIITELSRYRSLFVVARNSSFVFRGRPVDIREVGSKLGVGYVLEGSVRKSSDRIRVTAQLINAVTGEHVWADRFDGNLVDVFALQDEITRTIVSTIPGRLEDSQTQRILQVPTNDLNAYEQVLRGQKYLHQFTRADFEHASACFQRAIALDGQFARAHALLAMVEAYRWFWDDEPSRLARAVSIGELALAQDPHESRAHLALGVAHLFQSNHDRAQHHLAEASKLNPNDDLVMLEYGRLHMYIGQPDLGADLVRQAMRRNPYHPNWYWNVLGRCLHSAGDYKAAIPVFEGVIHPQFWTNAYLAACYAAVGNFAKAAEHRASTLSERPDFTIQGFRHQLPYRNSADLDRYVETLRDAALPP